MTLKELNDLYNTYNIDIMCEDGLIFIYKDNKCIGTPLNTIEEVKHNYENI